MGSLLWSGRPMEWVRRVGLPNDDAKRANRLLNALPKQDYQRLHPHLRPHAVQQKQDMGEEGGRISEVHFPVDAVVSILTRMDEGPSVEIATIGNVTLPLTRGLICHKAFGVRTAEL